MTASRLTLLPPVLLTTLVGVVFASCGGEEASPGTGVEAARILSPSDVSVSGAADVESGLPLSGSLNPHRSVQLRAQLSGTILEAPPLAGEEVEKGDLLARYDAHTFQVRLSAARSAVAAAQAAVATAEHSESGAEVLADAGAISEHDLRQARSAAEAARAQLEVARAEFGQAQETVSRTVVRSPMDGIADRRLVNDGEAVNPGRLLYSVVSLDTLELAAKVSAHNLSAVKVGAPVVFHLDAYPGRRFEGEVARVDPMADAATRQLTVYVRLPNAQHELVGGLYATGLIVEDRSADAVTVPADAVRGTPDASYVLAVDDGVVRRRPVVVGPSDAWSDRVVIRKGLPAGTTVVVGPDAGLEEGTRVHIQPVDVRAGPGTEGPR